MTLTLQIMLRSLGEVGSTILGVVAFALLLELALWLVFDKWLHYKNALPIMLLAPAAIGLFFLIVYPMLFELRLTFSNMNIRRFKNPSFGIEYFLNNVRWVFTQPVLKQTTFVPLLLRTFLWTGIQITGHVCFGLALAMLLNRKIRFRGLYRTVLVFPWAVPQIVAVLAWRGEFHYEYGYINVMLTRLGLAAINWKVDPFWNFFAVNVVNIWLGVPFMMITLLGGLQSIDSTYYEAADIDGAGGIAKFRHITLPLLRPVLTPAVVLGIIWTFNNFNVPYFINENELESSDILVTALFRSAFEYNNYGFAATFAFVIFAILMALTVVYMRVSGFRPTVRRTGIVQEKA
jgi:arabinogalactan oligomer/maltooligosaccharide transport system permease protein